MTSQADYPGAGGATHPQMHRRDRRAVLARATSSIAHALGTPLNVIGGRAAMVALDVGDARSVEQHALIIQQQARAISELLQRVAGFASAPFIASESCALDDVLRRAVTAAEGLAAERGVGLKSDRVEAVRVSTDPQGWELVVSTLVESAVSLADAGAAVIVSLERRHAVPPRRERGRAAEGDHACVIARFRGPPLPAAWLERPGEPWLTDLPAAHTDAALAFAVVYEVARNHQGWAMTSDDGSGDLTLEVCWPLQIAAD